MKRQKLILHTTTYGNLRAIFKTKHGRQIFISIRPCGDCLHIEKCYYVDRSCGQHNIPKKLRTHTCRRDNIPEIIADELDKEFSGVEIFDDPISSSLPDTEFILAQLKALRKGYKFLIFVGSKEKIYNGIPSILETRFKNRLHRAILLKLSYHHDGLGIVSECCYYDRAYKSRTNVIPESLTSVFFPYNKQAIIDMVNRELNCDFTDIIFTDNINIKNPMPLCGNI